MTVEKIQNKKNWQRTTDVMSSMPIFCSSESEGVSSLSLMPQIQQIMAWSLRQSRHSSGSFGPHISWSIAKQTQASYTLPHILGERCLEVRTLARVSWTFPRPHNIWQQWHWHSPHRSTAFHPGSRKWLTHQTWCHRHPLQSQFGHRSAEIHPYTIEQPSMVFNPCLHLVFVGEHKLTSIIAYTVLTNNVLVSVVQLFGNTENTITIWGYCGEFLFLASDFASQTACFANKFWR